MRKVVVSGFISLDGAIKVRSTQYHISIIPNLFSLVKKRFYTR